jgi:hypothetical protein
MIYQEKIFTKEECDTIIGYSKIYKNTDKWFHPNANIINNRLTSPGGKLSYNVFVILNDKNTEWFFNKLINWFSSQSGIKLNPNIKIPKCTLHCYNTGDKFPKHIDLTQQFKERRYNLGIQLNNNYEGGEYLCWDDKNNEVLISKETGTSIMYHCRISHEIKEITKGERWSIVMPITNFEIIETKNLL